MDDRIVPHMTIIYSKLISDGFNKNTNKSQQWSWFWGLWGSGVGELTGSLHKGTAYCLFKFSCPELRNALQRISRESGQMFLHICQEGLTCIYE